MAKAPYYTGDNVPLAFTVKDDTGPINPTSCVVLIKKPDESLTDEASCGCDADKVSYVVPTTVTDQTGSYHAYFEMTLPGPRIRTHRMDFNIVQNIGS